MSFPKHIRHVPEDRKAVAPYNFVELPETIVEAESLPEGDRYHSDRLTGKIVCTLTTESPLYTRGGWSPKDFAENGDKAFHELSDEMKQKRATFFIDPATQKPIIPGSSLRGMFRTLVEIFSFSKIDKVSDAQKFFFRAVAAKNDDPLAKPYKDSLKNVKAGYLVQRSDGWYIRPAKPVGKESFVWVKESKVIKSFPDFVPMTSKAYSPQYIVNVGFGGIFTKNNRHFAGSISQNPNEEDYAGVLVCSGNMAEGSEDPSGTKRKSHCLTREPDTSASLIKIKDSAIRDYSTCLTDFQKKNPPFNKDQGVLKNGRCIFYCQPYSDNEITLFGQSPNFRIPFFLHENEKVASAFDFIPDALKDSKAIDFADAIFGFVRDEKQENFTDQSRSGRVFFQDALCQQSIGESIWLSEKSITPKVLAEPKPTTFQHYLTQPRPDKPKLKHYGSKPTQETIIRGHKLYWHRGKNPVITLSNPEMVSDTQKNKIKPIRPGINFNCIIHFESLSDVELGALLWVLDIAQDDQYRLSLGMGKPLGMGAVKITHKLYLSQREDRYKKLFEEKGWFTGYSSNANSTQQYIDAFDRYVCERIGATDTSLREVRRIKMLLAMLSWENAPSSNQTRYMEIERDASLPHIGILKKGKVNEYADRPVLPTPLQVIGWEDSDNDAGSNSNSSDSGDRLIRRDNTHVLSKKLSEEQQVRQEKINQLLASENLEVGKQLEAVVLGKRQKGSEVTYEISGVSFKEKEKKQFSEIPDNGSVVVEIRSLKEDGSINHVKFIRKVDSRPSSWSAIETFRHDFNLDEEGVDDEFWEDLRDPSPGREVNL